MSDMKRFLKNSSSDERKKVAGLAGTTVNYFWQVAGGHRKPSALLAKRLEVASEKKMTRAGLRPDIY